MYLQHFGLRHAPLGKELTEPWDDGAVANLKQRFDWLLQSPGLGLLTGEPGVGKTAALRSITATLNPHRYLVLYQAETDFGRIDIYRGLARALGLEPSYRRAQLWRDIKQRVHTPHCFALRLIPGWKHAPRSGSYHVGQGYGKPPGPGRWYAVHFHRPGLGVLPLSPA